jgi:hypothetical protein
MLNGTGYVLDVSQMSRRALLLLCGVTILTLCLPSTSFAQSSARTIPRALDQLTAEADVIVHGYVTSAKLEPHPQLRNLMTLVVTMSVAETYKGPARKAISFRQYVWDLSQQRTSSEYGKGQELLLLLGPVSEYGLTSPVGLEQGRFLIMTDRKGNATAQNGRGNVGLFDAVAQRAQGSGLHLSPRMVTVVQQHRAGPLPLSDLQEAIRTFVGTR